MTAHILPDDFADRTPFTRESLGKDTLPVEINVIAVSGAVQSTKAENWGLPDSADTKASSASDYERVSTLHGQSYMIFDRVDVQTNFDLTIFYTDKHFHDRILTAHTSLMAGNDGKGTADDDILIGNRDANILSGLGGNDRLYGGAGNDILNGGKGDDFFQIIDRFGKDDHYVGGAGADTFSFEYDNEGKFANGTATLEHFDIKHDHIEINHKEVAEKYIGHGVGQWEGHDLVIHSNDRLTLYQIL